MIELLPPPVPTGSSDDDLTDEQRRIVAWEDGPLVVIAGAGTGKTRVIVERVRRLLRDEGRPERHARRRSRSGAAAIPGDSPPKRPPPIPTTRSPARSCPSRSSS